MAGTAKEALAAVGQLIGAINADFDESLRDLLPKIDKLLLKALTQHVSHLAHHGVDQVRVDPYKLVCWVGCSVLESVTCNPDPKTRCPFKVVAQSLIDTLCGFLATDSDGKLIFRSETRKMLLQMLIAEKIEQSDQGIWQNGLYAAFHCSVESLRLLDDSQRNTLS